MFYFLFNFHILNMVPCPLKIFSSVFSIISDLWCRDPFYKVLVTGSWWNPCQNDVISHYQRCLLSMTLLRLFWLFWMPRSLRGQRRSSTPFSRIWAPILLVSWDIPFLRILVFLLHAADLLKPFSQVLEMPTDNLNPLKPLCKLFLCWSGKLPTLMTSSFSETSTFSLQASAGRGWEFVFFSALAAFLSIFI